MIRLATADDLGALARLTRDYLAETGAAASESEAAFCLRYGIGEGEAIVVAEDGDRVVGFCAWTHLPESPVDVVHGVGTYVVPEYRGRRLSSQMREHAKAHCRQRGYRQIEGAVLAGNDAGLASALSSGARVVGSMIRWEL